MNTMKPRIGAFGAALLMATAFTVASAMPALAAVGTTSLITSNNGPFVQSGNGGTDPCPVTWTFHLDVAADDFSSPVTGTADLNVNGVVVDTQPVVGGGSGGVADFTLTRPAGTYSTFTTFVDGTQYSSSQSNTLVQEVVCGAAAVETIDITPNTATNSVGTTQTYTALVRQANQAQTPIQGALVQWTVTGANPGAFSGTTNASGQTSISYAGANAGTDNITACHDLNANAACDAGEPTGTARAVWTTTTLTLTPATATNPVGTQHTVVATVTDIITQRPAAGVTVRFTVSGANTASGAAPTDLAGQASFTYTGNNAGTDAISAFADTNNNGVRDPGEPSAAAAKIWQSATPPPPAADCTTEGHAHGNQHFTSTSISGKKQDVHAVVDADCDVNEKTGQVYLHHAMLEIHVDGGPAINARSGNRRHDITSVTFPTAHDAVISGMANGKPFTVTLHDGSKGNQGDTVVVVYPGYPTISGSAQRNEVHIDNH